MKSKLRLLYKLSRVIVLFAYGLVLAGLVFPLLGVLSKANIAKKRRDAIKQNWLNSFSAILNLHITQEGSLPEDGSLLVSNHISWLDIVVIGKFLPAYFVKFTRDSKFCPQNLKFTCKIFNRFLLYFFS